MNLQAFNMIVPKYLIFNMNEKPPGQAVTVGEWMDGDGDSGVLTHR